MTARQKRILQFSVSFLRANLDDAFEGLDDDTFPVIPPVTEDELTELEAALDTFLKV